MSLPNNDDIWARRGEDQYDKFTRHPLWTGFKWFIALVIVVIVITVIGGVVGFWFSWGNKAAQVLGPENTDEQFTTMIGDYKSMEQQAQNICDNETTAGGAANQQFLEDPSASLKFTFRRTAADYDRRAANVFEGKIVGPPGYPANAPTIEQMQATLGLTCSK